MKLAKTRVETPIKAVEINKRMISQRYDLLETLAKGRGMGKIIPDEPDFIEETKKLRERFKMRHHMKLMIDFITLTDLDRPPFEILVFYDMVDVKSEIDKVTEELDFLENAKASVGSSRHHMKMLIDAITQMDSYFPPSEKAPPRTYVNAIDSAVKGQYGANPDNDYLLFVALKKGLFGLRKKTVGSLSASWLAEAGGFLGYLYVDESFRRAGIGRMLMNAAVESFRSRNNGHEPAIIGEIEHLPSGGTDKEKARRCMFFSSLGFMKVDGIDYQQPHAQGSQPMMLIIRPEKESVVSYSPEQIINLVSVIYRDVATYRMINEEIKEGCRKRLEESIKQKELRLVPIGIAHL